MKELKLDIAKSEYLDILDDLKRNNKKEIVIIEVQIEMGKSMLEVEKRIDNLKNNDKKKDDKAVGGEKAIGIKMKLDAFEEQRIEMYDGLKFLDKKIDEISKAVKN